MKYSEARSQIKSGDLLAWSHKRWSSWYDLKIQIVRIFTRSEYCHVAVAYELGPRLFAVEAVSSGVRLYPLSRALPFYWIPDEWKMTGAADDFLMAQLGAPYSQFQAVLAAVGLLKPAADEKWECAELTRKAKQLMGRKLECLDTPSALVEAMDCAIIPVSE